MGDEHQRAPPAAEEVFQPLDGLDVEVIGGLVEQEQVGLPDDRAREQHAALHARREGLEGRGAGERHAGHDLLDGLLSLPGWIIRGGDGQARCHHIVHRARQILRHILLEQGHRRPGSKVHRSAIGLDRACEHPQERGLAGAVAAEEADPLPGLDVAGHIVEQRRPAKPERNILQRDERHA